MKKVADVLVTIGVGADKQKIRTKVGVMFETEGKQAIKLHVLPMPRQGSNGAPEVWLLIQPVEGFEQPRGNQTSQPPLSAGDEIPV